ncbi:MAG: ferritin-like domain-containing protein [Labilithrix sp.]|nr:ferritin-like domain-containing protein [Labilithrix sp.]
MTVAVSRTQAFPPYELLDVEDPLAASTSFDATVARAQAKTRKLERLYHQTQAHAWNPTQVLDELEAKHGGIHLAEEKREAVGELFSVILWGELAAWNIAADLARELPDLEAKMAATGQVFDEARHFTVLRDYMKRAGVRVPPLNPYGRKVLLRIIETDSLMEKLYGMQLLVENMALSIFKRVAASGVEPVLSELLVYIERDESRHVALGVLHLPAMVSKATALERARNLKFNLELFALTVLGGQYLDPYLRTLGVDHRELGHTSLRLHQQVLKEMSSEMGLAPGEHVRGIYSLAKWQQRLLLDWLHPEKPIEQLAPVHQATLRWFDRGVRRAAKWMATS